MADTYFKVKILCDYVIPLALLAVVVLVFAGVILKLFIQEIIEKRRERKNGKVRKEEDAV